MNTKNELHSIAFANEGTIIAKFEPFLHENRNCIQSEAELEKALIQQLENQGYEYAQEIKQQEDLKRNLKKQIEKLNECAFNSNEWNRFFKEVLAKENDGIVEKTDLIQTNHIHNFIFDNGKNKNIMLVDKHHLHRNVLQVVNQYSSPNDGKNRYDVSILVNGLPLVHIELKRRGGKETLKNAFSQIERYGKESFFSGSGLFNFVQIFIISTGTYTKYYANTTRERYLKEKNIKGIKGNDSFEFTSFWTDFENKQIYDLVDFTSTFLAKHVLLNVLFKYCVFDVFKNLLVMRPYQIAATEKIIRKIHMALNNKNYGSENANGYIWHSTGSGKTLTSFKTAQLATNIKGIEKVMFVVDRKDLDNQTVSEYNKFEEKCVELNSSTKELEKRLKDDNQKMVVTTIQKLSRFIENNKAHFLFDKPCVIIFDECHRSQFGKMHTQIKKHFKKHLLFGFTGTPIMQENKTNQAAWHYEKVSAQATTDVIFSECLHTYTIANAIKDKNVLPFKVDYIQVNPQCEELEKSFGMDEEQMKNLEKQLLQHPERIKQIVSYVLNHFDKKTHRHGNNQGFNSIFATSSIQMAQLYYNEFKRQNAELDEKKQIKFAVIFSGTPNEDGDENIETCEHLPKSSLDFLESAIQDYNKIFNSNYNASANGFGQYYVNVSEQMKNKALDMLIVVDMFLTGFDAKTLNTLWVDKNLKTHRLMQAYSRTNRILDSTKQNGNIVCFRDLDKATNESIILFSKKEDDHSIVRMRNFEDYYEGYYDETGEFQKGYVQIVEAIQKFQQNSPLQNLISTTLEEQKAFIQIFNDFLKLENILNVFDEFTQEKKIITEMDKQDLKSVYAEIREELRQNLPKESIDWQDISFEVALLKQTDINIDFIYKLLAEVALAKKENDEKQLEAHKKQIFRYLKGSLNLRNKKDLIEKFIVYLSQSIMQTDSTFNSALDFENFIQKEFQHFVKDEQKEELNQIIQQNNLKEKETFQFMRKSFKNKEISDLGTDFGCFGCILPKMSMFDKKTQEKEDKIFAQLKAFYEKHKEIVGEDFLN